MHSFVQQNLKMQGSSEMMTWTVQCLKEDKKVALTKTVPAAGILALPLNLELWLLPSSGEAAPAAPTRHWNEPTRSSVVVSVGLHFWDQSGPLSDQGHKYTEAQNIGTRERDWSNHLKGVFYFVPLCLHLRTFFRLLVLASFPPATF